MYPNGFPVPDSKGPQKLGHQRFLRWLNNLTTLLNSKLYVAPIIFMSFHQLRFLYKASGTAAKSFSSSLLESKQLTDEEEFDLKWSAASLYSGLSFFLHYLKCTLNSCCYRRS